MIISSSLGISISIVLLMWVGFLLLILFVKAVRAIALLGSIALLILSFFIFWLFRVNG